jgi:hypothetical protein
MTSSSPQSIHGAVGRIVDVLLPPPDATSAQVRRSGLALVAAACVSVAVAFAVVGPSAMDFRLARGFGMASAVFVVAGGFHLVSGRPLRGAPGWMRAVALGLMLVGAVAAGGAIAALGI